MPKRILVADDSATIQKAFAMVFGSQDVTLIAARSADEAISAARTGRPDLVIADAALGNSNGYDLCAALKAEPATRAVPVLILASNHVPYDETRGHRVGAAGSLLKPFESQSLIDQVGAALAKGEGARAPVVAAAPAQPIQVREPPRAEPAPQAAVDDDDDYGEFTIERPPMAAPPTVANVRPPPAVMAPPPSRPAPPPSAPVAAPAAAPALRPSLIPGVRPGAPLPARPAPAPAAAPAAAAILPSSPGVHRQAMGRTMMGLPAMAPPAAAPVAAPVQARPAPAPLRPAAPAPAPAPAPLQARPTMPAPAPAPRPAPAPVQAPAPLVAAVSSAVAQKVAAIAARGPEYEAIAKLSREIIEQVVWEVVPELAEVIIRQEVDRLASAKR